MQITRKMRQAALVVALSCSALAVTAGAQERRTPSPEVQARVSAVLAAINGNDAAVDTLVKEHFTEEYRKARSAEERRKWFEPHRTRLGTSDVGRLLRRDAETVVMEVVGEKGTLNFVLTLDEKTSLIKGLGTEEPSAR